MDQDFKEKYEGQNPVKNLRMKTGWGVNKDFCEKEKKYTFHTLSNRFTHIFAELSTKNVDN